MEKKGGPMTGTHVHKDTAHTRAARSKLRHLVREILDLPAAAAARTLVVVAAAAASAAVVGADRASQFVSGVISWCSTDARLRFPTAAAEKNVRRANTLATVQ